MKHVHSHNNTNLSKLILEELRENNWPGLSKIANNVMEELNITGVFYIRESKNEFKKKVKDICTKENDKSLKQMIDQYKKMKAMRDEIVKGNEYFFKESLGNIRTLFRFRVELFDAKGNFKNKKEVKEKGSLLCESCEKEVDENTHVLYCIAYCNQYLINYFLQLLKFEYVLALFHLGLIAQ